MDIWRHDKSDTNQTNNNYENIVITHDLQDCFDETFDLCFNKVTETKDEKSENAIYIGKIHGNDENSGLVVILKGYLRNPKKKR